MRSWIALSALSFLVACGADRVSGGNGTSTDNVVTARMLSIDSILSRLPQGDEGAYPLLVQLDSTTIAFDSAHPDGRDLRVYRDSTPLPFQLREWNSYERRASAWVRLSPADRGPGKHLTLKIGRDSTISRSDAAATWQGVTDSVRQKVSTIRLSAFDTDSLLVGTPCRCNTWYTGNSNGVLVTSRSGIDSAGKNRPGNAYHLSYAYAVWPGWALMGTRLGTTVHRFSGMDSITFWARGNGSMRVALEDGRDPYNISKAWAVFDTLTSSWKHYTVRPQDFIAPDAYNLGWLLVKNRINTFTVFGQNGSDFWITDIRIHGISPSEIP